MEKAAFSRVESQKVIRKPKNNKKKIFLYIFLSFLINAILMTCFILSQSRPKAAASNNSLSTPSPAPSGSSAPDTFTSDRLFFTRDLFPGLFSVDKSGADLTSHLTDKYPGFIHNMKRSGNKIGFNDDNEQETCIYDIKTGTVEVIKISEGCFCDLNQDQTKALVTDYKRLILVDIKTKEGKEIYKPAHDNMSNVRYSHDWKYIYYSHYDGKVNSLFRVNAADCRNLVKVHDFPVGSSGIFSFDGMKYAYTDENRRELHLFDMESKTSERLFSITKGTFKLLSSDADNLYLSFKDENSFYNSIYSFNLKEKKFESFEKAVKLETDNLKDKNRCDSSPFFVQKVDSKENMCAYTGTEVETFFDNSLVRGNPISKITPLRYDSKVIFKTYDLWVYDFTKKVVEALMREAGAFAVSPSGRRIAVYDRSKQHMEVFDLEKKVLVFSKFNEKITSATFSHDCESIFYSTQKGSNYILRKMDALTGKNDKLIYDFGPIIVTQLSMQSDGNIAFIKNESTLSSISFQNDLIQVSDLYPGKRNSFYIISWHDTIVYLRLRDEAEKEYCLYQVSLIDKTCEPVLDESNNKIHVQTI